MIVNGKNEPLKQTFNLLDFLQHKQIIFANVVIEYNGKILPREKWAETELKKNDILEIISFVGGG